MSQLQKTCSVTNGSQAVAVLNTDVSAKILKNSVFMLVGDLTPYTVAANSTFDGTHTQVVLTGAYQGATSSSAAGVFVTDFTYPNMIPVIAQGDVGTAAIFSDAMYKLQRYITVAAPDGLMAYQDIATAIDGKAATVAASKTLIDAALVTTLAAKTTVQASETTTTSAATAAGLAKTASENAAAAALVSTTSASTSATTATEKAAEALASAVTAQVASDALVVALHQFRAVFIGELPVDPIVDGNGNPLIDGAEYFNTTTRQMMVYDLGVWIDHNTELNLATQNAVNSAVAAASSAAASASSATAAATSLANIGTSEINSAASAASALASKNTALTAVTTATDAAVSAVANATSATSSAVAASASAAATVIKEAAAAASAVAAAGSASGAATSAVASGASAAAATVTAASITDVLAATGANATSAAAAAAAAEVSKVGADASAVAALTSANSAASSAAATAVSAAAVESSKTAVTASASAAAASETAAAVSATSALTSSGSASTSAVSATASKVSAAASATLALGSANLAESSKVAAEAAAAAAAISATSATSQANRAAAEASSAVIQTNLATIQATSAATSASSAGISSGIAGSQASTATAQASNATTSAASALASASTASDASSQATSQAAIATTQATISTAQAVISTTKAENSAASATLALARQNLAEKWADETQNVQVETGRYSAKHWALQAQASTTGSVIYRGLLDLSSGAFPLIPKLGDYYSISVGGTVDFVSYSPGDSVIFNGVSWDKTSSGATVLSVNGQVGTVVVTKADIGLGNVNNTLDSEKPISLATGVALDTKENSVNLATVARTGSFNDLLNKPVAYSLPVGTAAVLGGVKSSSSIAINETTGVLSASAVSVGARGASWVPSWTDVQTKPTTLAGYGITDAQPALGFAPYNSTNPSNFIAADGAPVQSVGGFTGAVTKTQLGISNVDNTTDAAKPVSAAQATADTAIGSAAASDATTKANAAQAAAIAASTPVAHIGSAGTAHGVATITTAGFESAADKTKLDGIATGATAYSHPANHPSSVITQDALNRFVTDAEKSTWSAKQVALGYTPTNAAASVINGVLLSSLATGIIKNTGGVLSVATANDFPDWDGGSY